jgi:hypothetical protein
LTRLWCFQAGVAKKKTEIEALQQSNEKHSQVALEIDEKISAIEAAHAAELTKLGEAQAAEKAKTERVLESMRAAKTQVLQQISEKEAAVTELDAFVAELEVSVSELSKKVQGAETEADAEIAKGDADMGAKKSEAVSKTTALRTQALADAAVAAQARSDFKDLEEQLSSARFRKDQSDKRVQSSSKNVSLTT